VKYLRDGRAPIPESEKISRVMSANRGEDTSPEMMLRGALRESGLSGYRLHWKNAPGRPDIAYPGKRVAIFTHGCYWHRCPHCDLPLPKSHTDFWNKKFERNKERDERKLKELEEAGWTTIVVWECRIKDDLESAIDNIRSVLEKG
jgi:DNA mismatch endonuclease (patch repair protein)